MGEILPISIDRILFYFILFYFLEKKKVVFPAFYHLIPLKKEFHKQFAISFVSLSSRWSNNIEACFDY
jgi:hypothetical protein